jgi:TRAP-type C4-dicarboxylate transport system permease small subunit
MTLLRRLHAATEHLVVWMAGLGAAIIFVQMLWISYGVLMRYGFRSPDRYATEATALLLFPVAFVGLGYALREDALPRVTMLIGYLPAMYRRAVDVLNYMIMIAVAGFFAIAALRATFNSFQTGAASEILMWPRYAFWAPAAASLVLFTVYAVLKLALLLGEPVPREDDNGMV